jgi:hypothetical protein
MGNPNLTDQQVEAQSWGQTWADNPINQIRHADYSMKSFEQSGEHEKQTWAAEGRDMMDGPMGTQKDLMDRMGEGKSFEGLEDDMFGPEQKQG